MSTIHPISKLINDQTLYKKGAHILYMYNDFDKYIENAVQFSYEGKTEDTVVFFIYQPEIIEQIKEEISIRELPSSNLIFLNTLDFYLRDDKLDITGVQSRLNVLFEPYFHQGFSIRIWGKVPIENVHSALRDLKLHECTCDQFIRENKIMSICPYSGYTTPAFIQNELLKSHTHFLTDDEYCLSPFYHEKNHRYPSTNELERLQRIESQNEELLNKNAHLMNENNVIKGKKQIIEQSEKKLRTIIDKLPLPVIIRQKSEILFSNQEAKNQFEIDLESFFHYFDTELDQSPEELLLEQPDDNKHVFLVKSINTSFEGKEAILHSFVDLTKEKENEDLMVRSEKLNIAGELAVSIAHEVRNPLTAIKGFIDILKTSGQKKEKYFSIIENELSRIEQISSELLLLAKPHSENRKNHNIVQLMNDVKLLLTSQANMKSIEFNLEVPSDEIIVNCEETKIKQVFINLVKNAIEASSDGGNITLAIRKREARVQVQVIDEGTGISQEVLAKIGEPFYTTKEKGTGIGLMICYQIIENHEGTIDVESEVGVGTTFTITLQTVH
ncbi:ATP-binding protein [Halalkalibacter krulwichiae]|uniref:histidine kinase n=1 Tax=Halalkalibacter krulwichiae TaxID=199441 RepID=A0A1X9MIJ9_9BACI|nr:ATP-binding protein [Halalkalibacter krulwichiae]ARK32624.1 Sporulation kinase A [Halalkalibacter krulwichiae]